MDTAHAFANQQVGEFLDSVAAREPTPGGGGVAAAAGALAVAMGRMVAAYSIGKRTTPETAAEVNSVAGQLAHADKMLRRLVAEDAAAYGAYMAARKSDDPADAARATAVAIAVPMEIAAVAVMTLRTLDVSKAILNRNLISDLGVAAVLAEACARAAAYNVRINLRDSTQADPAGEVREELDMLLQHAREACDSIAAFVDADL